MMHFSLLVLTMFGWSWFILYKTSMYMEYIVEKKREEESKHKLSMRILLATIIATSLLILMF